MKLSIGDKAPAFSLKDQAGKVHTLADYLGKYLFIYFYPKDDTPGCTIEACSIRDSYADFKKYGVVTLGISADTEKSHASFIKKFELPFTLLSDLQRKVVKEYDVWGEKNFMGRDYMGIFRTSFLIDPEGKIAKIYEEVKPKYHIEDVLRDLKKIKK